MCWLRALHTRKFVVVGERHMDMLLKQFPMKTSWIGDEIQVDSGRIPDSAELLDFIKSKLETGEFTLTTFEKKGIFARKVTVDEAVIVASTKTEDRPDKVLVYNSPWAKKSADSAKDLLMLCPLDGLVYKPEKGEVYTMEKLAIQHNFSEVLRSSTEGAQ